MNGYEGYVLLDFEIKRVYQYFSKVRFYYYHKILFSSLIIGSSPAVYFSLQTCGRGGRPSNLCWLLLLAAISTRGLQGGKSIRCMSETRDQRSWNTSKEFQTFHLWQVEREEGGGKSGGNVKTGVLSSGPIGEERRGRQRIKEKL